MLFLSYFDGTSVQKTEAEEVVSSYDMILS